MINTREIAAEYRLERWVCVVRRRIESGLTVKAFCESSGIHPNTYFYWQRKLRGKACGEMAGAGELPAPGTQKFIWPVDPHPVTGPFNEYDGRKHLHRGIDIGVNKVPVSATANGKVLTTGYTDPRGNFIYIDHGDGTQSVYEHLLEVKVKQDQYVPQGYIIAISGNSGKNNGKPYPFHLHFELLIGVPSNVAAQRAGKEPPFNWPEGTTGYHVDPEKYLER